MKIAVSENGDSILASATAAATALCPDCGGTVELRRRRLMAGGVTYYWRHQDNRRLHCHRRSKAVQ